MVRSVLFMFSTVLLALLLCAGASAEQGVLTGQDADWQRLTVWRDVPPLYTPAPRPADLQKRRVVILWNGKHNSDIILHYFADQLRAMAGVRLSGGREGVQYLSIPHDKEEAEQGADAVVADKPDLVVMGMGDCRVCAAWLAVQACMIEEKGVPTVALLTRPFYKTYRNVCQNMRMAPLTVLTTDHPVAAISTPKVHTKAEDLFNQFWCLFPQERSTRR